MKWSPLRGMIMERCIGTRGYYFGLYIYCQIQENIFSTPLLEPYLQHSASNNEVIHIALFCSRVDRNRRKCSAHHFRFRFSQKSRLKPRARLLLDKTTYHLLYAPINLSSFNSGTFPPEFLTAASWYFNLTCRCGAVCG